MQFNAWIILACLTHCSAYAADVDPDKTSEAAIAASVGRFFSRSTLATSARDDRLVTDGARYPDHPSRLIDTRMPESPFALAIRTSVKKGIIELGVEAYSEVLIACQKEQSATLTLPSLRSDSQQAHCFRF